MYALTAHTIVPGLTHFICSDVTDADNEVTEVFALVTFKRIMLDHGSKDSQDLGFRDAFCSIYGQKF